MKNLFAIAVIAILISSCASFDLGSIFGSGGSGSGNVNDDESEGGKLLPIPVTMQEQGTRGHWISLPSNGSITVIGISNPMMRSADELNAAQEDAARKIAMYYGIDGVVETVSGFDGRRYFGSINEFNVELNYDQDYLRYKEQLIFDPQKDVIRIDGVTFVRFQYATSGTDINYTTAKNSGRPQWTKSPNPPQINGFMTSIGIAQNQARIKDTVNKSIEAAIATMVQELSTSVTALDSSVVSTSALSGGSSNTIATKSKGKLNGFHVLEFWIDPDTKYVYTLAIARKSE